MRVCLDTNVYSALLRGDDGVRRCLEEAADVTIPTIVLGELHADFALGACRRRNSAELAEFLALPGIRVVAPDADTAERYGALVA